MEKNIKEFDLEKLKLRDDDPVDEDQFEDETHDQVANTLVKLITEKEGGFAIGLEGSWGSGKSTVAKITEQKIEDSTKDQNRYVFFTFDTWAHQGDPIRRSFLECLAGKLYDSKILKKNYWVRQVRKFRSQTKKVSATSIPKVTTFNYLMAIYALIAPFAILYASYMVREDDFLAATGITLIFVSVIILTSLITYLFRQARNLDTKNLPVIPSFKYLSEKTSTEQYVETEDATTIEFNKHFDSLIRQVQNSYMKIVVVLDNLDRVSSDEFISMWGTMRNFFIADKDSKRESLLRNVYLIVPFDHEHINEIFNKSVDKSSDNKQLIGEEFVDKTFRFVLDVAPPITTNWESFFNKKLIDSFEGQLEGQELHDLKKLFDLYHQHKNKPITPRRIKTFINDLILQLYERNGEIPIKYIALYVLYKNEIKSKPNGIITKEIFNQRTKDFLEGEDWIQNVVAAHYKVNPDNALQLVFGNRITDGLIDNKIEEFEQIKDRKGFKGALTKVITTKAEEWAKSEPISFAKVARSFEKIELDNTYAEQSIWRVLAVNTKHVKRYSILDATIGEGLANIISNAPDSLLDDTIDQICTKIIHNEIEDAKAEKYSTDFFEFLLKLNSSIVSTVGNEKSKRYLSKIKLPKHPKTIIHLASQFYHCQEIHFERYDLNTISSDDIQKEFINRVEKGITPEILEKSLVTFYSAELTINWNSIAGKIHERLQNKNLEIYEYESLISMLTFLKFEYVENAQTNVTNLTKSGYFLGVLNRCDEKEMLCAILVFHILEEFRKIESVRSQNNAPVFGNVNSGHKKFLQIFENPEEYSGLKDRLADFIKIYEQLPQLLKMISENPNKNELLIKVFQELLDEGFLKGLNVNHVLNYYSVLNLESDDQYFNHFFELLDEQNLDVDEIKDLKKIKEEVLKASINSGSKFGSALYNRCQILFSKLSKEEWNKELKSEGLVLKLVRVLVELDKKSFINRVDFRDALRDYTNEVLFNNKQPTSFSSADWKSLPNAMSKTNRESFYKLLYTDLISEYRTSEISYNVFKHYGEDFIKAMKPSDRADKFTENVLLELIQSNVKERLDLVIKNIDTLKQFFKKSKKENQDKIKEAINSKDAKGEGIDKRIKKITEAFEFE